MGQDTLRFCAESVLQESHIVRLSDTGQAVRVMGLPKLWFRNRCGVVECSCSPTRDHKGAIARGNNKGRSCARSMTRRTSTRDVTERRGRASAERSEYAPGADECPVPYVSFVFRLSVEIRQTGSSSRLSQFYSAITEPTATVVRSHELTNHDRRCTTERRGPRGAHPTRQPVLHTRSTLGNWNLKRHKRCRVLEPTICIHISIHILAAFLEVVGRRPEAEPDGLRR